MTSRETCLIYFVQNGAQFWKYLLDCFGLSKWKPRKKISRSYLQRGKMKKGKQREFLITWESLNYKKSLQQLPSHRVSSLRETRCFAKCFRHYFGLSKKRRWKSIRRNYMYASKIKKKGEAETKSSDWDSKNALTNTNLRTVKRYEVGICIGLFSFLNILMYRFRQG